LASEAGSGVGFGADDWVGWVALSRMRGRGLWLRRRVAARARGAGVQPGGALAGETGAEGVAVSRGGAGRAVYGGLSDTQTGAAMKLERAWFNTAVWVFQRQTVGHLTLLAVATAAVHR